MLNDNNIITEMWSINQTTILSGINKCYLIIIKVDTTRIALSNIKQVFAFDINNLSPNSYVWNSL